MFIFRMKSLAAKLILITGSRHRPRSPRFQLLPHRRDPQPRADADHGSGQSGGEGDRQRGLRPRLANSRARPAPWPASIGRGQEGKYLDRKAVLDMLKANVERNQFAFGSWFARRAERLRRPVAFAGRQHRFRRRQGRHLQPLLDEEQGRRLHLLDLRFRLQGRMVRACRRKQEGRDVAALC